MLKKVKNIIKKTLSVKSNFYLIHLRKKFSRHGFKTLTYSGDGEDVILQKIFKNKVDGFYVDVGALHPKYISNTFLLYKKGWRGINIDPNLNSIKLYERYRPNDINLNLGISDKEEDLTYYDFTYFGMNTMDSNHANEKQNVSGNKLIDIKKVRCLPLSKIFDRHLDGRDIDVLDVDVEGLDLKVLKSNNWEKYKPRVILVEDRNFRDELQKSKIYEFLHSKGYKFYCYNNITLVMINESKLVNIPKECF